MSHNLIGHDTCAGHSQHIGGQNSVETSMTIRRKRHVPPSTCQNYKCKWRKCHICNSAPYYRFLIFREDPNNFPYLRQILYACGLKRTGDPNLNVSEDRILVAYTRPRRVKNHIGQYFEGHCWVADKSPYFPPPAEAVVPSTLSATEDAVAFVNLKNFGKNLLAPWWKELQHD